jgi:probable phosphoglycerate mutase
VAVTVREGLREFGAESGPDVVERFGRELELVADAHRGEAVLVVTHGGTMSVGVPALART